MAYNIDERIRGNTFLEFLEEMTQDAEFKMIRIPLDAPNEQNIIDFERKRHFHVVGVMRGGAFIVPTPETSIKPNDTVACLNRRKGIHLLK